MDWFIDMCILIFYAEVDGKYYKITEKFVKDKQDNKFVICCYISKDNMPKWIRRQRAILKVATRKILNQSYLVESDEEFQLLLSQDKIKLNKLILIGSKLQNKEEFVRKIKKNQDLMLQRIQFFLLKIVDKEVIPINEIDPELKSTFLNFLKNHSDSMTLASGIQHHQQEEVNIFTGDKKDWNTNNLQWVYDSRPELLKRYPKIPQIKYIQDYK